MIILCAVEDVATIKSYCCCHEAKKDNSVEEDWFKVIDLYEIST